MQSIPDAINGASRALRLKQADNLSAVIFGFSDDSGRCIEVALTYLVPQKDVPFVVTELVRYNLSFMIVRADSKHGTEYRTHSRQSDAPAFILTYILPLEVQAV